MRTLLAILALLVATGAGAPADARPSDRPGVDAARFDDRPRARRADRIAGGDRAERVKKKLRKLRAVILVDELDLDETSAARLFPVLQKYDDEFARLARDASDLRRALADAEAAGDDRALEAAIDALVANQRKRWDLDEARFAAARKVLTARQAARLLVVLPEIDRRILEGARRAADGKGDGGGDGKKKGKGKRGRRNGAEGSGSSPGSTE